MYNSDCRQLPIDRESTRAFYGEGAGRSLCDALSAAVVEISESILITVEDAVLKRFEN